ncbi:MAG TPA: hypothetical protein VF331_13880 [Polyangiales bacterium]
MSFCTCRESWADAVTGAKILPRGRSQVVWRQVPTQLHGWWRITETQVWAIEHLDLLGPAMISFTGHDDRLRMLAILAYVDCTPTKTGVSFTWEGASEYDPISGTGTAKLGKDGRLKGTIKIKDGDSSTFVAERAQAPDEPIADASARGFSGALRPAATLCDNRERSGDE